MTLNIHLFFFFIDMCSFLPWAYPLVVPQGSSPLSPRDGSSSCVYSGAVTPSSLLELSSPLPDFSSIIRQGSNSLEEVCPLQLILKATWFSLELMFSRSSWHQPWGSSFASEHFTATRAFYFCSRVMRQFQGKKIFQAVWESPSDT